MLAVTVTDPVGPEAPPLSATLEATVKLTVTGWFATTVVPGDAEVLVVTLLSLDALVACEAVAAA